MAERGVEHAMARYQRQIVGTVYPLALLALAVVPWIVTAGDLPDPIAVHFGLDGQANGSMPTVGQVVFLAVLVVGPAALLAWMARRPHHDRALGAPVAAFIGILNGSLWLSTALANQGHRDWHDVHLSGGAIALALVGSVGATLPITLVVRRQQAGEPHGERPVILLAAHERAAWFGHTRSYPFLVGGVLFAIVGIALLVAGTAVVAPTFLVVGVVFVAFASVTVSVSDAGVRVRSGPLGWPSVQFGLDRVDAAEAIDVRPMALGGWGYRGSVRAFGRASWILRGGPGLELRLRGGGRFVVTVDHADEAAAVVNGLVARVSRPG